MVIQIFLKATLECVTKDGILGMLQDERGLKQSRESTVKSILISDFVVSSNEHDR